MIYLTVTDPRGMMALVPDLYRKAYQLRMHLTAHRWCEATGMVLGSLNSVKYHESHLDTG